MATERITAPIVKKVLYEHLQKHELKTDSKLHDVQIVRTIGVPVITWKKI